MTRAVVDTGVSGCFEVRTQQFTDHRGALTKPFMALEMDAHGVEFVLREIIWSHSRLGVIRGLHFQTPPVDGAKYVFCVSGCVRDVVLDLRVGSPTFGDHAAVELSPERANAIYVPSGCAHGFEVLSDTAIVAYAIDADYQPDAEGGIRWDSAGVKWLTSEPVLSEKDGLLGPLAEFESPFRWHGS